MNNDIVKLFRDQTIGNCIRGRHLHLLLPLCMSVKYLHINILLDLSFITVQMIMNYREDDVLVHETIGATLNILYKKSTLPPIPFNRCELINY
jgi:hypothetical protein